MNASVLQRREDPQEAGAAPAYRQNGRPVDAAAFYRVACDPARPVAVEACAGAGKTWMLVSRIVRALLAGTPPHEILAISFTRKAAGEMRARLGEWLADFARADTDRLRAELRLRGLDEREAAEAAPALKALYAQVLSAGRPVQIRTFHSWFAALVAAAPVSLLDRLGLPANAELVEDDAAIAPLVWRRLSAALIAAPELRADYEALVFRHGRAQVQKALEAALARRVEFALADEAGVPGRSVQPLESQFPEFAHLASPDALLFAPQGRETLRSAARALGAHTSAKTSVAKAGELEAALGRGDADGIRLALLTKDEQTRKFSEKMAGIEAVQAAQALVMRVGAARRQHDAWEHQQRMTRVARLLVREFAQLKRERGLLDMGDIELAASRMLSDPLLGGFVLQRLDARVRHLLIDEFQDTNPLQWQALYGWLSAYAGTGGGAREGPSVFIVGDPKQSIYRFRRAEPQVFRAAQAFVREGLGGDLLACDHTRRCAPELIGVVNPVMLAAQAEGRYDGFRAHTTGATQPGAALELPQIMRNRVARGQVDGAASRWRDSLVEPRTLPEETLARLEAHQAAGWIAAQLAQGLHAGDVMVLSRRRAPLVVLNGELRERGIAATEPEKTDLGDAPEVRDIVALLDALVSPGHDLSLARALRSPLFSLADDALVRIALARKHAQERGEAPSWFDLLQEKELYIETALALQVDLASKLMRWKDWTERLTPHDALAAIYHDGDVLARFAAAAPAPLRETVLANLRAVLTAALAVDSARYATPYALVRALRRPHGIKAPASVAPDAVRLLTVHGAKGLEAPVVLLLDAEGKPRNADSMGVLIDWPGEAEAPLRFVFLASEKAPGSCCVELLAAEQAAREREELNGLYVAITRAADRLAVSSIEPYAAGMHVGWRSRLVAHCEPVGEYDEPVAEAVGETGGEAPFSMPDLPPAQAGTPVSAIDDVADEEPVEEHSQASGHDRALHRLLRLAHTAGRDAAHLSRDDVLASQAMLIAQELALSPAQSARLHRAAQNVLDGPAGWLWDSAQLSWQEDDVALVHEGETVRVARLVRRSDSGEWWALGDRSIEPAPLRRCRAALQASLPGAVVRTAFLDPDGVLHEAD